MQRTGWKLAWLGIALLAAGCNSSSGTSSGKGVRSDGLKPDAVVKQFLESVRTGDDEGAASMLTELAREMAAEHDMVIAPDGSDTAKYAVGETEELENDIAHVESTWTDDGEEHQIIWALRQTEEGWRIAGMATKIFEDLSPVLLNFEDPEDMFQQQNAVEQEMYRRTQAANAGQPGEGESDASEAEMEPDVSEDTEDRQAAFLHADEETPPEKARPKKR